MHASCICCFISGVWCHVGLAPAPASVHAASLQQQSFAPASAPGAFSFGATSFGAPSSGPTGFGATSFGASSSGPTGFSATGFGASSSGGSGSSESASSGKSRGRKGRGKAPTTISTPAPTFNAPPTAPMADPLHCSLSLTGAGLSSLQHTQGKHSLPPFGFCLSHDVSCVA